MTVAVHAISLIDVTSTLNLLASVIVLLSERRRMNAKNGSIFSNK